jgi:hypothetical protein
MIANCPSTTFTPATRLSASAMSTAANFERSAAPSTFTISSDCARRSIEPSSSLLWSPWTTIDSTSPDDALLPPSLPPARATSVESARLSRPEVTSTLAWVSAPYPDFRNSSR